MRIPGRNWAVGAVILIALGGGIACLAPAPAWAEEESGDGYRTLDRRFVEPRQATPPSADYPKNPAKYHARKGGGPFYHSSRPGKMARKLFRGFHNIFLGWVEIPKNIIIDVTQVEPVSGFVTGTLKGIAKTLERAGAGVVEVLTFWSRFPDKEFEPLVFPEFPLSPYVD